MNLNFKSQKPQRPLLTLSCLTSQQLNPSLSISFALKKERQEKKREKRKRKERRDEEGDVDSQLVIYPFIFFKDSRQVEASSNPNTPTPHPLLFPSIYLFVNSNSIQKQKQALISNPSSPFALHPCMLQISLLCITASVFLPFLFFFT